VHGTGVAESSCSTFLSATPDSLISKKESYSSAEWQLEDHIFAWSAELLRSVMHAVATAMAVQAVRVKHSILE